MDHMNNEWTFPEKISFTDAYTYYSKIESDGFIPQITLDCTQTSEVHASFIGFLITFHEKIQREKGTMMLKCSEYLSKMITEMNLNEYFFNEKNYSSFRKTA
ncbi:MAG: hypothetical protein JW982_16005 [Spirochaetes bacterium]|nr:hypothetical protein [Spirochaetota bacterium]